MRFPKDWVFIIHQFNRWIRRYEETGALEVIEVPGRRSLTTEEEDFNLACSGIFKNLHLKLGHIFIHF